MTAACGRRTDAKSTCRGISMKSHALNVAACALLMSLTGCVGEKLTAFPNKLGTWVVSENEYRGPDPLTLDRRGRGPEFYPYDGQPAPPPLVSGWANTVYRGADPFPRDQRISHVYQGLVRFDLGDPLIRAQLENPEKQLYRARLVLYMTLLKNQAIEGVDILGTVEANVESEGQVRLGATARWKGDCRASTLKIETGATIYGGFFAIGPGAANGNGPR